MWVYTNTLTRELNRYRPDRTRQTDRQTHFKSFHLLDSSPLEEGTHYDKNPNYELSIRTPFTDHGDSIINCASARDVWGEGMGGEGRFDRLRTPGSVDHGRDGQGECPPRMRV